MSMLAVLGSIWLPGAANANTPACASSTCYFDLTGYGSSTADTGGTSYLGGAVFSVPDSSGNFGGSPIVGTGVLDPFVRIQGQNGSQSSGIQTGFNTGSSTVVLDDLNKGGTNWNHPIQLGSLNTVNVGGVDYYQFILDINQQGNTPGMGLSMDQFKLFYADSGNLTDASSGTNCGSLSAIDSKSSDCGLTGASLAYNMDTNIPASILMNYKNQHGSGYGIDLQALVPVSSFSGASANSYVYLYSQFGATGKDCQGVTTKSKGKTTTTYPSCKGVDGNQISTTAGDLNMASNAGFEEWATNCKNKTCTVAEPESMTLMGLGLLGLIAVHRRRTA